MADEVFKIFLGTFLCIVIALGAFAAGAKCAFKGYVPVPSDCYLNGLEKDINKIIVIMNDGSWVTFVEEQEEQD